MKLLVIDLEATCDEAGHISRSSMEIIEIGGAVVSVPEYKILDTYQGYIKPVVNPKLSAFCKELTGIKQETVDAAPMFYDAISTYREWLDSLGKINSWASWGNYDKGQFEQDCNRHSADNPHAELKHLNLKNDFGKALGIRRCGMANAFAYLKHDMQGRHHSGLDDAINIARLFTLAPNFGAYIAAKLESVGSNVLS